MGFNALHLEQVMTDPQRLTTTREESEIRWPYPPLNESKRPNVVVIVLDDVGFGQIGCYGSSIKTPHMDADVKLIS